MARGRTCNYVKFQTSRNLPPVLKIVTHVQLRVDMLLSTCRVFYFYYGTIILTGLQASIGVTVSSSSPPFLCALDPGYDSVIYAYMHTDTACIQHVIVGLAFNIMKIELMHLVGDRLLPECTSVTRNRDD